MTSAPATATTGPNSRISIPKPPAPRSSSSTPTISTASTASRTTANKPTWRPICRDFPTTRWPCSWDYIRNNPNPLGQKHLLDRSASKTKYNEAHAKVHPLIRDYLQQFVLYDVFMVDAESGDILYSVFKEIDYGTSLRSGPLAKSSLADVFKKSLDVTDDRDVVMVDFAQYFPSYEAPAGFIASPLVVDGKRVGSIVFQVPLDRLTQVMSDRSGLGETGETILVGSDFLPRTDSYRDPENRTVVKAFRNPPRGRLRPKEFARR